MSGTTYLVSVYDAEKPLLWLKGEIKTPPFSTEARIETGMLLRRLQQGESIGLPESRPMPIIGSRCHELRVRDENRLWRIFYHLGEEEVVILGIHQKTTQETPAHVVDKCIRSLKLYRSNL